MKAIGRLLRPMSAVPKPEPAQSESKDPFRRSNIRAQNVPPCFSLEKCGELDLFEVSIDELQTLMNDGQLTAEQYATFCLNRIRQVNDYLKAVIEVNPDAISIARQLDEERREGHLRGRLHGIPVLVKDNMATKDRMQTTAGSWALLGSRVVRDAHVVQRLRKAGAIVLGHANMSEWASCRSSSYSTGYSPRGDQTRNPYKLSRSPRGSSSGSAVAVTSNIVPIAFGTETDTSIIGPAMVAGIVGIKPTVGLTSRNGVIPISKNLDTVGPFGRTVTDAAIALGAIAGPDEKDVFTMVSNRLNHSDYTDFLSRKESLKGAVFGLPQKRCWEMVPEPAKSIAARVLASMEALGATVEPTDIPSWQEKIPPDGSWNWTFGPPDQSEYTVVKVDAYNGINAYLSELEHSEVKTLADVVNYNIVNTGSEGGHKGIHPAFPPGQDGFEEILSSKGDENEVYHAALKYIRQKCREEGIDGALKRTDKDSTFDALLFCDVKGIGQQIAAQAGYPIITIPIGIDDDGIPVSLSIQHTAWREADLIKWASAIEDMLLESHPRPLPLYRDATSKIIPIR